MKHSLKLLVFLPIIAISACGLGKQVDQQFCADYVTKMKAAEDPGYLYFTGSIKTAEGKDKVKTESEFVLKSM